MSSTTTNTNTLSSITPSTATNKSPIEQQQTATITSSPPQTVNSNTETVQGGNPNGSTLRKERQRSSSKVGTHKYSTSAHSNNNSNDATPSTEIDEITNRKITKKELAYRAFDKARFRKLNVGDYVAARVASHELWILARIVKPCLSIDVSHAELISLTEAKRSALFKEKVNLQDVEEYDPTDLRKAKAVNRQHVLPLPCSYSEAEEWGTRCRKGFRVYAMYPSTTSLYSATVIDNTTYCRGDDDIIVVEFDGDEAVNGKIPQRHIPARFVTLIPREFPAAQVTRRKINSRRSSGLVSTFPPQVSAMNNALASASSAGFQNRNRGVGTGIGVSGTSDFSAGGKNRGSKGGGMTPAADNNKPIQDSSDEDALNSMISEMAYGENNDSTEDSFDKLDLDNLFDSDTSGDQHSSIGLSPQMIATANANNNAAKGAKAAIARKKKSNNSNPVGVTKGKQAPSQGKGGKVAVKKARGAASGTAGKSRRTKKTSTPTVTSEDPVPWNPPGGPSGTKKRTEVSGMETSMNKKVKK